MRETAKSYGSGHADAEARATYDEGPTAEAHQSPQLEEGSRLVKSWPLVATFVAGFVLSAITHSVMCGILFGALFMTIIRLEEAPPI